MRTPGVVALDPAPEAIFQSWEHAVFIQKDALVFDATPKTLDVDIIPPSSLAIHTDGDTTFLQLLSPFGGSKLAPLIGNN